MQRHFDSFLHSKYLFTLCLNNIVILLITIYLKSPLRTTAHILDKNLKLYFKHEISYIRESILVSKKARSNIFISLKKSAMELLYYFILNAF